MMKQSITRLFRPKSAARNEEPTQTTSIPPTSDQTTGSQSLSVIELFQSQGCNSCPPSNANLIALSNQDPNILLLTFEVTYWDYLGWPDTFGAKDFDRRQRDYVHRMQLRSAFTPQVIVNGVSSGVGNTKSELSRLLQQGGAGTTLPVHVSALKEEEDGQVLVSVGIAAAESTRGRAGQDLEVWLITYNPSQVDVNIRRGENAGKCLPHVNVVKGLEKLGALDARQGGEYVISGNGAPMARAILVQDGPGGAILGAARVN